MNGEDCSTGIDVHLSSLLKQIQNKNKKHGRESAFSYISALIFVTVIGISLTTGSVYWSTVIKREKEKELLFRGDQIRRAIESYYNGAPGGGGSQYPASLNDLLKDPRYLATKRHLRKIYKDPMTKDGQWGLITAQGGRIKGVFSKNKEKPLKVGNFPEDYKNFEKADKYSDWKFVHPIEKEAGISQVPPSGELKEDVSVKSLPEEELIQEEELEPEEEDEPEEEELEEEEEDREDD